MPLGQKRLRRDTLLMPHVIRIPDSGGTLSSQIPGPQTPSATAPPWPDDHPLHDTPRVPPHVVWPWPSTYALPPMKTLRTERVDDRCRCAGHPHGSRGVCCKAPSVYRKRPSVEGPRRQSTGDLPPPPALGLTACQRAPCLQEGPQQWGSCTTVLPGARGRGGGAGHALPLPVRGMAAWAPPPEPPPYPHRKKFWPGKKKEIYQWGRKLEVDFRYTKLLFGF